MVIKFDAAKLNLLHASSWSHGATVDSLLDTGYWILDASQTDPPSDLPNRQFGERA